MIQKPGYGPALVRGGNIGFSFLRLYLLFSRAEGVAIAKIGASDPFSRPWRFESLLDLWGISKKGEKNE